MPFNVDDLEDFQTEYRTRAPREAGDDGDDDVDLLRRASDVGEEDWFKPQRSSSWKEISRVLVTQNTADHNATLLILFDEPVAKEYLIHNATNTRAAFSKYDVQTKQSYGDTVELARGAKCVYVWDKRELLTKRIKVTIKPDGRAPISEVV